MHLLHITLTLNENNGVIYVCLIVEVGNIWIVSRHAMFSKYVLMSYVHVLLLL